MATLFTGLTALIGGAGAGAGAAAATGALGAAAGTAATVGATAASGISLATILQGTATVLGIVASIGAGNAEADQLNQQAVDAEREQPLETLQGIERRTSIKRAMADALGAEDTAYAASGVDLSFGTAANARKDAYREADTALTSDAGTEQTRVARLSERAANYRIGAKRARKSGLINGLIGGLSGFSGMLQRG